MLNQLDHGPTEGSKTEIWRKTLGTHLQHGKALLDIKTHKNKDK